MLHFLHQAGGLLGQELLQLLLELEYGFELGFFLHLVQVSYHHNQGQAEGLHQLEGVGIYAGLPSARHHV